mmetsp:Transcript_15739/g.38038  ORF Transcript_15739/g.38038 Transcript_15739/m.38038 type:complete len:338 (-) Transcript_15739:56-1069(-)
MRSQHSCSAFIPRAPSSAGCSSSTSTTSALSFPRACRMPFLCWVCVLILSTSTSGTSDFLPICFSFPSNRALPFLGLIAANSSWFTHSPPRRCLSMRKTVLLPLPGKPRPRTCSGGEGARASMVLVVAREMTLGTAVNTSFVILRISGPTCCCRWAGRDFEIEANMEIGLGSSSGARDCWTPGTPAGAVTTRPIAIGPGAGCDVTTLVIIWGPAVVVRCITCGPGGPGWPGAGWPATGCGREKIRRMLCTPGMEFRNPRGWRQGLGGPGRCCRRTGAGLGVVCCAMNRALIVGAPVDWTTFTGGPRLWLTMTGIGLPCWSTMGRPVDVTLYPLCMAL